MDQHPLTHPFLLPLASGPEPQQVEYAIEAINNAGTCVGILAKDGIVMASERRITSGLLAPAKVSKKIPSGIPLLIRLCQAAWC